MKRMEDILDTRVKKALYSVAKQYPDLDIWLHCFDWFSDSGDECNNLCHNICFGPKGWKDKEFIKDDEETEMKLRKQIELALWEVVKENPDMDIFVNIFDFITRTGPECEELGTYLECNKKEDKNED